MCQVFGRNVDTIGLMSQFKLYHVLYFIFYFDRVAYSVYNDGIEIGVKDLQGKSIKYSIDII